MSRGVQGAGGPAWPFYGMLLGSGLRHAVGALALSATMVIAPIGNVAFTPGLGIGIPAAFAALVLEIYARGNQ